MTASTPNFSTLLLEERQHITWIVLNRPERANSFSNELLDELSEAFEWLKTRGAPVIGIRGAGKGFSAGMDLQQGLMENMKAGVVADRERLDNNIARYLAIWDHPKPVIAAVHGYCFAAATQLCIFTDITIVAQDTQLGGPQLPVGGGYVAPLWATLVGPKRAKELSFQAAMTIDGRTAVEWGWANRAVKADELITTVEAMARRIARTPPDLLRIKKLAINRAMEAMGVRAATGGLAEMDALLHQSEAVTDTHAQIRARGLATVMAEYSSFPED